MQIELCTISQTIEANNLVRLVMHEMKMFHTSGHKRKQKIEKYDTHT